MTTKLAWTLTIAAFVAAVLFLVLAPGFGARAYDFDGRKMCVRKEKVEPCWKEPNVSRESEIENKEVSEGPFFFTVLTPRLQNSTARRTGE